MQRLNVLVIDMFNMTYNAAEWHSENDDIHFNEASNDYLMDYVYPVADRSMPLTSSFRNLLD